jgi:hypothetical protein
MTKTSLLAASLVLPLIALSGTAYAGPANSIPPRAPSQISDAYAQYVPATHADGYDCLYQGGPKSPIVHAKRH